VSIHFTANGIYTDTEEERLAFYDRLCAGDPVIWGHIVIWERECDCTSDGVKPEVSQSIAYSNFCPLGGVMSVSRCEKCQFFGGFVEMKGVPCPRCEFSKTIAVRVKEAKSD
jgi:hypothetical protein